MEQPLVSVIIPSYNHAVYLNERIDSVLAQDYPNFEVIILDDCSTDNSREIIAQYEGKEHVREIIFNEQNTGNTFLQWEKGVGKAKGKYIWIAESDDVAEPAFLSTLVGELEKQPDSVLAYSYSKMIDWAGYVIYEDTSLVGTSQQVKVYDGSYYLHHYMLTDNCIYNASMVVFRKDIFSKVNQKFKEYRWCGDWFFWACACKQGKVIEVRIPLSCFRQHMNKVTTRGAAMGQSWINMSSMLEDLYQEAQLGWIDLCCQRVVWARKIRFLEEAPLLKKQFPHIYRQSFIDYIIYKYAKKTGRVKRTTRSVLGLFCVPLV